MPDDTFYATLVKLEKLVQTFETFPDSQVRDMVFGLLQHVDLVHRQGLGRLMALLVAEDPLLVERAVQDPVIHTLLDLYDLLPAEHPVSSASVGEPADQGSGGFVPLQQLEREAERRRSQSTFHAVAAVDALSPGTMKMFEVAGVHVLVANVEGEIFAVRNQCPGSVAPLHLGTFNPPILICPWHNEAFDIRTGQRVDGPATSRLAHLPVVLRDGVIHVTVAGPSSGPAVAGS